MRKPNAKIAGFSGRRVLIAEDQYLIARLIALEFQAAGASIVGPAASCAAALEHLQQQPLDAAILDIKMRDGEIYPVAEKLAAGKIPFVFYTGYDARYLPKEFAGRPCLQKPCEDGMLLLAVRRLFDEALASPAG